MALHQDIANPVLCCTSRSGIIENFHRGTVCCVELKSQSPAPILHHALGDIDRLFYPRSALKYVQVLPLLESGAVEAYGITDDEIAVMCASHNGEPQHITTVRSILSKAGLDESYLRCGGHTPLHEPSVFQYVRNNNETFVFANHSIYNNCSGKHAGFLALCKFKNFDLETYLQYDHPVQVLVRNCICDVFDIQEAELHAGIDGCSAPAYAMNAYHAALGYARLCSPNITSPRHTAIQRMIRAITTHPFMIYGTNGFCTRLMEVTGGRVIGKRGAAGVYMAGVVGAGVGMAIKLDDGTMGPQYNIVVQWLHAITPLLMKHASPEEVKEWQLQLLQLESFSVTPNLTCKNVEIGATYCSEELLAALPGIA